MTGLIRYALDRKYCVVTSQCRVRVGEPSVVRLPVDTLPPWAYGGERVTPGGQVRLHGTRSTQWDWRDTGDALDESAVVRPMALLVPRPPSIWVDPGAAALLDLRVTFPATSLRD